MIVEFVEKSNLEIRNNEDYKKQMGLEIDLCTKLEEEVVDIKQIVKSRICTLGCRG